jgi:ParB family chromosome partitioning protein
MATAKAKSSRKKSGRKVSLSRGINGNGQHEQIVQLPPSSIVEMNPYQPRDEIVEDDDLREMAASIRKRGHLVQPIVVRPLRGRNRFQLVVGERRLRAVRLAEMPTVPAIVRQLSDQEVAEEALIENLHRRNLKPPEEGRAVQMALDLGMTLEELAERTGKSEAHLRLRLRIFKELSAEVQKRLHQDELKVAHAEVLLDLDSKKDQKEAAEMAVKQNLTAVQLKARTQHKPKKPRRSLGEGEKSYGHQQLSRDILALHANIGSLHIDPELPAQTCLTVAKQLGVLIKSLQKTKVRFEAKS